MPRDHAAERIRRLMALAAVGSGATEEEARTAALAAVRMMLQHDVVPGDQPAPAIDLDEVAALSFRVLELEHLLAEQRTAHACDLQERDRRWAIAVQMARDETRAEARRQARKTAVIAAREERESQARSGGEERARRLGPERRSEIARVAAAARWQRWRERRGIEPR